ncbi:hypothetical protein D047_0129A, partial [Vibrio parahaemolyticus VPTS-2010_2]
MLLRVSS